MSEQQKQQLRQLIRQKRCQLDAEQQQQAMASLLQLVSENNLLNNHQHLAFYLANDHEVNPELLINYAWQQNKTCYLPVLHPQQSKHLAFAEYQQ